MDDKGTCELVIYCHECKTHWQLNPEMIALALATNANLWEVYNYILTTRCKNCKKEVE
jgi:hypothetical protein